jgi:hypothetical protein
MITTIPRYMDPLKHALPKFTGLVNNTTKPLKRVEKVKK